jgi:hypothetical protein
VLHKSFRIIASFVVLLFACLCLRVTSLKRGEIRADDTAKGQSLELLGELRVESLLSCNEDAKYVSAVTSSLAVAGIAELSVLKRHANWGIALQTAWTEWGDDRRRLSGAYDRARVRDGVIRWLGFMEGRLGIEPPVKWAGCVKTAQATAVSLQGNTDPLEMSPLVFDIDDLARNERVEVLPGLFAQSGIEATRDAKTIRFALANKSEWSVDLDKADGIPLDDDGEFSDAAVDWYSRDGQEIMILRRLYLDEFYICARKSGATQNTWSVHGGGTTRLGTSCGHRLDHFVFVESNGETVFVFGCCRCCVYIEGHNAKTGQRTARFSSALW